MTNALFTPVYSVVATKRRRFFWAVWWEAPPEAEPFRKPDASSGGARSPEEARARAIEAAGAPCVEISSRWARAWTRVLRGEPAWPPPRAGQSADTPRVIEAPASGTRPWARAILGVPAGASADEIRSAFKKLALVTHPDQGGDALVFMDTKRAFDIALAAALAPRKRRAR